MVAECNPLNYADVTDVMFRDMICEKLEQIEHELETLRKTVSRRDNPQVSGQAPKPSRSYSDFTFDRRGRDWRRP
jgi:hypothetical protein